jgi:hypothetical protein
MDIPIAVCRKKGKVKVNSSKKGKKKKKKKKKTISIKAHPQKALQMCATGFTSSNCMAYSSHIRNKK